MTRRASRRATSLLKSGSSRRTAACLRATPQCRAAADLPAAARLLRPIPARRKPVAKGTRDLLTTSLSDGQFAIRRGVLRTNLADDGEQDIALLNFYVEVFDEVRAKRDAIDVTEHVVLTELRDQTIVEAPHDRAAVVAPIGRQDALDNTRLRRGPAVRLVRAECADRHLRPTVTRLA